jgi:hypothetical protein
VITCLYEVLLYAEGDDAINYAQAAHAAARLINKGVEDLDSVRVGAMIEERSHGMTNSLMLQIATSKPGRGGRRKLPLVFTEHGALMAATLLNSRRAVEMSIYIVRAFVQLRDMVASNAELSQRVTNWSVARSRSPVQLSEC